MSPTENVASRTALFSVIGNLLLAGIKLVTGIFGNSFALVADAIESLTDTFTSLLVYLGLRYAMRPADENHPYGHGKAEPLITFLVVVFLIISAGVIIWQSIVNIQNPHETPKLYTLWILAGIIIIKEVAYRYVKKKGEQTSSTALKADAWHHRSDAITSMAAFAGILVAVIMGPGYEAADDWAALAAAGIIIYNAYLMFRPALSEVMDEHVYEEEVEDVRNAALEVPGIIATEKCFIRKHGMRYVIDLHAVVDGNLTVSEGHDIAHALKSHLMSKYPQIHDVLIHIEPDDL